MIDSLVKYFAMIFCSFYIYVRILNYRKLTLSKVIISMLMILGLSMMMFMLESYLPNLRIIIMIFFSGIIMSIITKTSVDLSMISIILSFGLSYGFYAVVTFTSLIILLLLGFYENVTTITIISSAIIQILLSHIPFMLKRFKNGLPFLKEKILWEFGVLASLVMIAFIAFMGNDEDPDSFILLLISGVIIGMIATFIWCRKSITKHYINKLEAKKTKTLEAIICEKDIKIEKLTKSNDFLSKRIHRDNKLIPAVYMSIIHFLNTTDHKSQTELQQEGKLLIRQLEQLSQDRLIQITKEQIINKSLPPTHIPLIDSIFEYMFRKAAESNIDFNLIITGDIRYMTENIITTVNLETLIADLAENSIIASNAGTNHTFPPYNAGKILITLGVSHQFYELTIEDSGIPFDIETLLSLGESQITTHADDGGSGLGFMAAFDIMREIGASLHIIEEPPSPPSYTKKIIIRFDNRNNYIISSYRSDAVKEKCVRENILIEDISKV